MKIVNYKHYLLLFLCFVFFAVFYISFLVEERVQFDVLKKTRIEKNNLVYNVTIHSNTSVYNYDCNCVFFPDEFLIEKVKFKIYSNYKVKSYVQQIDNNYFLNVFSDDYYQLIPINITHMPIISIFDFKIPMHFNIENEFSDFSFENSLNELSEPKNVGVHVVYTENKNLFVNDFTALLSIRGASSSIYDKKPYKIKLDENFSMYGLNDDVFAFDALMTDRSKVRNLLSSEMWNLINDNQVINNDLNGYFCELFINNSYYGLYSLKNKINSKTLALGNESVLLKSVAHLRDDYIEKLLLNNFSMDEDGYFLNYQVKKYDEQAFDSIVDGLKEYHRYYSYNSISKNFYLNNYLNYYIFVSLISGGDNISYNRYLSINDSNSKILITPWDMDLTWGLNWSDNAELHSVFSMESSNDINWMNNYIVNNMDDKTLSLMKDRYWELRRNVITMDTINSYLDSYKELLVNSGAASRDSERWYQYDVENEIETIREWACRRIQFLDEYFS